mgnify:FL=1
MSAPGGSSAPRAADSAPGSTATKAQAPTPILVSRVAGMSGISLGKGCGTKRTRGGRRKIGRNRSPRSPPAPRGRHHSSGSSDYPRTSVAGGRCSRRHRAASTCSTNSRPICTPEPARTTPSGRAPYRRRRRSRGRYCIHPPRHRQTTNGPCMPPCRPRNGSCRPSNLQTTRKQPPRRARDRWQRESPSSATWRP